MIQFDDSFANSQIAKLHEREKERSIQTNALQLGYEYINLDGVKINPEALLLVEEKKARAAFMLVFTIDKKNISVAAQNPNHPNTQQVLQELQNKRYIITMHLCTIESLETAWEAYKDVNHTSAADRGIFKISAEEVATLMKTIKNKSDMPALAKKISTSNNTTKISETLSLVFAGALALRASDIHIEPGDTSIQVRYRLDGVLQNIIDIDRYLYQRIMSRLKILSGMILNTKSNAQDGRFTFHASERDVEVRSSIIPGALGESAVLRILDPSVASFSLDKISLNPYLEAAVQEQLKKPNGLIINTGPTGSGKTTALYAFLREVLDETKKIITIENPVEYKIEGIVHTQIDADYTFASGLRAILRQDPDVIMIGEIRDKEVAETALHAAQTGHLVFSTLHTNSAIAGFTRLIDLGVDPRVFGSAINIIIGQRLARLLCDECKTSHPATTEEEQFVKNILAEHPYPPVIPETILLSRAVGCSVCGGDGYKGRVGIFEAIIMDAAVEEVVLRDPREHAIAAAAKPQKIPTMLQDGVEKVLRGVTSLSELERVIEFPQHVAATQTAEQTKTPEVKDDDFSSHIV
jgi:type IV pilus assembly protein PilB